MHVTFHGDPRSEKACKIKTVFFWTGGKDWNLFRCECFSQVIDYFLTKIESLRSPFVLSINRKYISREKCGDYDEIHHCFNIRFLVSIDSTKSGWDRWPKGGFYFFPFFAALVDEWMDGWMDRCSVLYWLYSRIFSSLLLRT